MKILNYLNQFFHIIKSLNSYMQIRPHFLTSDTKSLPSDYQSLINFPERLFVLGGGPGLELLWPHREEIKNWGYWAIQRADVVKPFLEFVDPLCSICFWPPAKKINKGYGIQLLKACGGFGSSSISHFMTCFSQCGGKQLFLFGYDGNGQGYWRNQVFNYNNNPDGSGKENTKRIHIDDCKSFNQKYNNQLSLEIFHLGPTNNIHFCQISIEELKEIITHE